MNTASCNPTQRPELYVLRKSHKEIPLIFRVEQDIHKSIEMAHHLHPYLSLYMYMSMSKGAMMGKRSLWR